MSQGTTVSSDRYFLRREEFAPNVGTLNLIVSFGEDEAGNLYIVSLSGNVFRLEAA